MHIQEDYPNEQQRRVVQEAERLMQETMARYDPSHDAYHVQRVRNTAISLAKAVADKKPDLLVVELAALLHDVLDKKYMDIKLTETEREPLNFFRPFFERVASHIDLVDSGQAALIGKIVDNVSWTTEKKLRQNGELTPWHETCIELHCVQDADRLDAIGALGSFGIMRCAAYSSAVNRPLHTDESDPKYEECSIAHFHDKLLKIKDWLKTAEGKRLGEERHKFMLDFLEAVSRESSI